ncbi:hypothetical protein PJ985_01840 [Streptomyces sp. ACA25]|uniref:hypothetical protein n=1 Tax=Streptomyces sp. ACA25 TaxID=3022596 RepID=UPI002307780E|nr:hypothetical protein [Streptomyces sp. ACA25]MDB1086314.1 hypothetical protein [Streptomyces sp. ACA25]
MAEDIERIHPSGIPEFTGDLGQLESDQAALRADARAIRGIGASVHRRFQGLSAFYQAPEAEQLFASTLPVKTRSDEFATDLETVSSAVKTYAAEIRPLVARLRRLKAEAQTFVSTLGEGDGWREDTDKVDRNNELLREISVTVAEFWAAERTAANRITGIWSGTQWAVDDGSGGEHMYGLSTEDMAEAGETPWGKAVERKRSPWDVGHHFKNFVWDGFIVEGIWGTLTGLGGLVGLEGAEAFEESWKGLGQLATGLAIVVSPVNHALHRVMPDGAVKDWMDDSLHTTVEVGKAMVAWDDWSENPARAAGLVSFNVLTTVATAGTGTAIKGAGASGTAARVAHTAGRVGAAVDPMTYIGRGVGAGLGALPKVGNLTSSLGNLGAVKGFELPDGSLRLPDGTTVPPGAALPELPPGRHAVELQDGTVRLPDGSTLHPDGRLDAPDGRTVQTPDRIPAELNAGDRATLSADDAARHAETPAPAFAALGDMPGSPTARAGDSLPGATAHHPSTGGTGGTGGTAGAGSAGDLTAGGSRVAENAVGRGGSPGPSSPGPAHDGPGGGTATQPGGSGSAGAGHLHGDGPGGATPGGDHIPGQRGDTGAGGDTRSGQAARVTPEEGKEIVRRQVERANTDTEWAQKYYREDGHRHSVLRRDENGDLLPQLVDDPTGQQRWIAKHDLPPAVPEAYLYTDPITGHRSMVSAEKLVELDHAARQRQDAITADTAAGDQLKSAQQAYAEDPTPELRGLRDEYDSVYKSTHTRMSKAVEDFGEMVARQHAIPEHYPNAREILTEGKPRNNSFDQIWKDEVTGRYIVVEAKGSPEAPLGERYGLTGKRVKQGTRYYFDTIVEKMRRRGSMGNVDEHALSAELRQAIDSGNVDYVLVKAEADGVMYAGYSMEYFDVRSALE